MLRDRMLDSEHQLAEPIAAPACDEAEPIRPLPHADPAAQPTRHPHRRAAGMAAVLAVIVVSVGVGAWQSATLRPWFQHVIGADVAHPQFGHEAPPPLAAADPAPGSSRARDGPNLAVQADNAARELAGSGDGSYLSWNPQNGLWERTEQPSQAPGTLWAAASWQSAQALRALVRYLQQTDDTQSAYQDLIARTYQANVREPVDTGSRTPADQTVWWGLAWVQAARYELYDHHDRPAAARYLTAAASDASAVAAQSHACPGPGISSGPSAPPQTLATAASIQLAAQLGALSNAGRRLDVPTQGRHWLANAEQRLAWLQSSGLADPTSGQTRAGLSAACRPTGPASTATQGMLAEALVTLGAATHVTADFNAAASVINYALMPASGLVGHGVLQEPCENEPDLCANGNGGYAQGADKGLLTDAIADWTRATGSTAYAGFLATQAHAVLANAAGDGRAATHCQTPASCQIGFYWSRRPLPAAGPLAPTPATQAAGLSALSDALSAAKTAAG
jgi:Glycosyl hydrolase family 76